MIWIDNAMENLEIEVLQIRNKILHEQIQTTNVTISAVNGEIKSWEERLEEMEEEDLELRNEILEREIYLRQAEIDLTQAEFDDLVVNLNNINEILQGLDIDDRFEEEEEMLELENLLLMNQVLIHDHLIDLNEMIPSRYVSTFLIPSVQEVQDSWETSEIVSTSVSLSSTAVAVVIIGVIIVAIMICVSKR